MTFDDIRRTHPGLGLALYAYEPGVVILELMHDGQTMQFSGPTAQAAIDLAFPPAPPAATEEDLFG